MIREESKSQQGIGTQQLRSGRTKGDSVIPGEPYCDAADCSTPVMDLQAMQADNRPFLAVIG